MTIPSDEEPVYLANNSESKPGVAAEKAGEDQEPSTFRDDSTAAAVERLFAASGIHPSVPKEIL